MSLKRCELFQLWKKKPWGNKSSCLCSFFSLHQHVTEIAHRLQLHILIWRQNFCRSLVSRHCPAPYVFVLRLQAFSVRLALDKTNLLVCRVKPRSRRHSLRSPLNSCESTWVTTDLIWPLFGWVAVGALIVFRVHARGDGEEKSSLSLVKAVGWQWVICLCQLLCFHCWLDWIKELPLKSAVQTQGRSLLGNKRIGAFGCRKEDIQ